MSTVQSTNTFVLTDRLREMRDRAAALLPGYPRDLALQRLQALAGGLGIGGTLRSGLRRREQQCDQHARRRRGHASWSTR